MKKKNEDIIFCKNAKWNEAKWKQSEIVHNSY